MPDRVLSTDILVRGISGSGLYGGCGQQGSYAAQGGQAGHSKVLAVLGVRLRSVAGVRAAPLWVIRRSGLLGCRQRKQLKRGWGGVSEASGVSKRQGELDQRSRGACDIRVPTAESRRQGSGSPQSGKLAKLEAGETVSFTRSGWFLKRSHGYMLSAGGGQVSVWGETAAHLSSSSLGCGSLSALLQNRSWPTMPETPESTTSPGDDGKPLDPGPGSEECWWREELGLKLGFGNISVKALFLPLP